MSELFRIDLNVPLSGLIQGRMMENSFNPSIPDPNTSQQAGAFDYSFVSSSARIALYDDLKSAPRIIEIEPAPTNEYIESLASKVYEQARLAGGSLPYTTIREVSENLIHAQFAEIVVSIFDRGDTIRFADQGPGIKNKDKSLAPGYTSAVEPMKKYIRGVGSGLPIVKEYLDFSHGTITIDDNLENGSVVTISLIRHDTQQNLRFLTPHLNERERLILPYFLEKGALGVTDLVRLTGIPASSTHSALQKLEELDLLEKTFGQKRILTELGFQTASSL